MKFRIILALVLLVSVVAGGIALYEVNRRFCDGLIVQLNECIDLAEEGKDSGKILEDAKNRWDSNVKTIRTYVLHDRVEAISVLFVRASVQRQEEHDEFIQSLNELVLLIKNLSEYDKPSIQGIL